MNRAVRAEWTKLRTVPSTAWSLLALVALPVALGAVVMAGTDALDCVPAAGGCATDPTVLSLSGVYLGQLAAVLIAVLAVSTEYDTMMIRTTLAADPRRGTVLAAKAVVVTAVVVGAGLIGVLGSVLAGRLILPGNGFTAANGLPPPSLADGPTVRAAAGTVLYLGLVALLGLGVAAAVRHTAAAVTTAMAVLYLPVLIVLILPMSPRLEDRVQRYSPMSAGLAVQSTVDGTGRVHIGPWTGLGVLAGYAGGAAALGGLLLRARDA
jgi:ABC-2 type transport system permease protein